MNKIFSVIFLSLIGAFLSSCLEELQDIADGKISTSNLDINPAISLPLIDTRIYMSDFVGSLDSVGLVIREGDYGTVVLTYKDSIFTGYAQDYFSVKDQTSSPLIVTGLDSQGENIFGDFAVSESGIFSQGDPGTEKLDSLIFSGGFLVLNINSSFSADANIIFSMPELLVDGQAFTDLINISNGVSSKSIPLAGKKITFDSNGTVDNQISYSINGTISSNGSIVTPEQSLEISFSFISPIFQGAYGKSIDRVFAAQKGEQEVNFFQNTQLDGFSIKEPKLKITLENSFGAEFSTIINQIAVVDQLDNVVPLTGSFLTENNPFLIGGPTLNQIGESVTTIFELSHENSNINELVSRIPKRFIYDASGFVNGGQEIYVLDTSKLKISAEIELPLFGSVDNLVYSEVYDLTAGIFENIEYAKFTLLLENKFPINASAEVYFLNDQDIILDAFFNDDPQFFIASPVDVNGVTTESKSKEIVLDLSRERITVLEKATKIRLKLSISTSGDGTVPVRITFNDYINIHIGLDGRANL